MLAFLHPGLDFNLSKKNVFALLLLAEEYQIRVLKSTCEEFLLSDLKVREHFMFQTICTCLYL